MSKKTILAVAIATLAFGQLAKAQTNIQVFYDFGKDRKHVTTTVEGFYNDNWGNTFFFIDHDFNNRVDQKIISPNGTYMEIARCLNFWQNVPVLNGFSLQVEYNGGIYNKYAINSAFLAGIDYFVHSKDFKNTFNFKVLYKHIVGVHSQVPMQFTFVWGMQDIFGVQGLRFSGFADVWGEKVFAFAEDPTSDKFLKERNFVFISEPQLWYNVGQHFGCPNLHVGTEIELSCNFAGYDGFKVRPCLGTKWVF